MQGVHNNAGRSHEENGSVESAHGHLKRRICQALIQRGSNDFSTIEEYQAFITQQVMRHNRNNQNLVKEEHLHLKPLTVRVSRSCTINVKYVVYNVPSRLVGQLLRWQQRDHDLPLCQTRKREDAGPSYRLPTCGRQSGEKE